MTSSGMLCPSSSSCSLTASTDTPCVETCGCGFGPLISDIISGALMRLCNHLLTVSDPVALFTAMG